MGSRLGSGSRIQPLGAARADPVSTRELLDSFRARRGLRELVAHLQVHEPTGRHAEERAEPHRRVWGDATLAVHDLGDPRLEDADALRQQVGRDAEGVEEVFLEVLAWMFHASILSPIDTNRKGHSHVGVVSRNTNGAGGLIPKGVHQIRRDEPTQNAARDPREASFAGLILWKLEHHRGFSEGWFIDKFEELAPLCAKDDEPFFYPIRFIIYQPGLSSALGRIELSSWPD